MSRKKEKIEGLFEVLNSVHAQRTLMRMFKSMSGLPTRKHEGIFNVLSKTIRAGGAIRTLLSLLKTKK